MSHPARRAISHLPSSSHLSPACSPTCQVISLFVPHPLAEQRWRNAAPFAIYSPENGNLRLRAAFNCRLLPPKIKNGPLFLTGAADVKEVGLIVDICRDSLA